MNRWAGQPLPITATAWRDGELSVRLSGSAGRGARCGREARRRSAFAERVLAGVREQTDPFFSGEEPLWRLSVPSTRRRSSCRAQLIEWGGALRWLEVGRQPLSGARCGAAREGHATLFRAERQESPAASRRSSRCSRACTAS